MVKPAASWGTRLRAVVLFAMSREGRHDIGAVIAAATAVYTALKSTGAL